ERILGERSEENLTEADFVTGDVGAKGRRADIEAEDRLEEIARRVNLLDHRITQMEVTDRPKPTHRDGAATVESAVELRLPLQESGEGLAIGRIEIGNLARAMPIQAEPGDRFLRALAQIDRETHAQAEEQLQMGVPQMLDRNRQFAAGQML